MTPDALPDAVIFDVDGTLIDDEAAWSLAALQVCRGLSMDVDCPPGLSLNALVQACRSAFVRTWPARGHATRSTDELHAVRVALWLHTLQTVGWPAPHSKVDGLAGDLVRRHLLSIVPDAELCASLRALASYCRLAVCTNGRDTEQTEKLRRAGLGDVFHSVTCGGDTGIRKPDPRIFQIACRSLGVHPDRCLYVGNDWAVDVLGARNAGMRVAWITPAPTDAPLSPDVRPYRTVRACIDELVHAARAAACRATRPGQVRDGDV